MDQDRDRDLERCDENREKATRGDLLQRRVNNQRHGIGLRRRSIKRVISFNSAEAPTFAADSVPSVGLLVSFLSILVTLMQIKYLNGDASPYETNPSSMAICLEALCICALAVGIKMMRQTLYGNCPAHIINRVILISGVLFIAAILSIVVTNWLSWIFYTIWAIFSVMIMAWNSIHLIKQSRVYQRTENAFFGVINVFRRFKQRVLMIIVGRRMQVEPQGPSAV